MQRLAGSIVASGFLPSGSALTLIGALLSRVPIISGSSALTYGEATAGSSRCASSIVNVTSTATHAAAVGGGYSSGPAWWRQLSTASGQPPQPLLHARPFADAVPLPSAFSCPTLEALDAHIQRHGFKYSLRHVAVGLTTLSELAPVTAAAGAVASRQAAPVTTSAAAPIPRDGPPPEHDHPAGPPRPAVEGDGDGLTESAPGPPPSPPPPPAAGVAECARRLALLGRHQVTVEVDVGAMAQCIRGLAGVDLPLPARAQLALPFVKRLRDPAYFFTLRQQPADSLLQLLIALGRLPLRRHAPRSDMATISQVLARLVVGLTPQVAALSAADACRATAALVRLGCTSDRREAETYRAFLRALAAHISQALLEGGHVAPDQAVRLLWAYAVVAPGSCGPTALGAGVGGGSDDQRPAPVPAHLAKSAKPAPPPPPPPGGGGDGGEETVCRMVGSLCRVACRGLDSHPPLELVKLVYALPRLGAQREAEAVLPRLTPRLLQKLDSLDAEALADLASSYQSASIHEPGLMQALADRVLEEERSGRNPISSRRVISQLLACYGPGGSHHHPSLLELLQRIPVERLAGSDDGASIGGRPHVEASNAAALRSQSPSSRSRTSAGRRERIRAAV